MNNLSAALVSLYLVFHTATPLHGAARHQQLCIEIDPLGPASAIYESTNADMSASNFSAKVDFNVGGVLSMGPEFWSGAYVLKGTRDADALVRREDLWPNERHKLKGMRVRWNVTFWEVPASMRGWFLKAGLSYTDIASRANRYTEHGADGNFSDLSAYGQPDDDPDFVNEVRRGVFLGFGQRWLFRNRFSVTMELAYARTLSREINVDSSDPRARGDFDDVLETLPFTKFSAKPYPEANLGLGYSF